MAIPNALSLLRIVLVPIVVALLLIPFPYHEWWAAGLFLIASLTDLLDGRIARSRGDVTVFGTFIDSLADKLLIVSVLIALVEMDRVSAWVAIIVVAREFAVTGLRLIAAQDEVIAASRFGKAKMVLQVVAVVALMLNTQWPEVNLVLVLAMLAATIASGVDYFVNGWRHLTAGVTR